jgi:hypothetical protein
VYSGEWAWKSIEDRLQPCYQRRDDHDKQKYISGNIPLLIGPSNSGTNYLQMH